MSPYFMPRTVLTTCKPNAPIHETSDSAQMLEPVTERFLDSNNDDGSFSSGPRSASTSFGGDCSEENFVEPNTREVLDSSLTTVPNENGDGLRWSKLKTFSAADMKTAIRNNHREAGAKDSRFPDMFRYGNRFNPDSSERNVYRTVVLSDLPIAISYQVLLGRVRGGMVVDAKILDTMTIIKAKSALVIFAQEQAAKAYVDYAKEHHIVFGDQMANVKLVQTPTWPIPINILRRIQDWGETRCFEVLNFPGHITYEMLLKDLAVSPVMTVNAIDSMRIMGGNTRGFRFSSIKAATIAAALFQTAYRYRGCKVQWLPDPCAEPLETLL